MAGSSRNPAKNGSQPNAWTHGPLGYVAVYAVYVKKTTKTGVYAVYAKKTT